MLKMRANNRYLNWAETCYKVCYLLFAPNFLLFRKIGGTPSAKSKIQRMSPNFVHCMYLIFEPILQRRNFWGIPLHRNAFIGIPSFVNCSLPSLSLTISLLRLQLTMQIMFTGIKPSPLQTRDWKLDKLMAVPTDNTANSVLDSARSGGGDIEISGSGKSTPKSQFKRASGQNHANKKGLFINSRTAIAGAIIGLLLIFYNSKNLNCIGALSFYDSKRSIGEVLFF